MYVCRNRRLSLWEAKIGSKWSLNHLKFQLLMGVKDWFKVDPKSFEISIEVEKGMVLERDRGFLKPNPFQREEPGGFV